jgi:drug/metabolite transporter (DMT)-like permease
VPVGDEEVVGEREPEPVTMPSHVRLLTRTVRRPHAAPPSLLAMIGLIAVIDTVGYVAFNFGVRHADTTIVATAATPYALVPITAGVVLLHERPGAIQWAGGALVIAGLVLLGLVAQRAASRPS